MTDDIFKDPHSDEGADDPFLVPEDEEFEEEVGSPATNPIDAARNPNRRRAVYYVIAAVVFLAVILVFATRGGEDDNEVPVAQTQQIDETAVAQRPTSDRTQAGQLLGEGENTNQIDQPGNEYSDQQGSGAGFVNPEDFGMDDSGGLIDQGTEYSPSGQQTGNGTGQTQQGVGEGSQQQGGNVGTTQGQNPYQPMQGGTGMNDLPQPYDQAELDRQARLDAQREAEELARAQEEARLEYLEQEEERLRSAGTLILSGNTGAGAGGGPSRVASPAGGDPSVEGQSDFVVSPGGAQQVPGSGSMNEAVLPGTEVPATLLTAYSSQVGGGRVQARLRNPLRDRNNRVVLPAGTQAFGQAQASAPGPGSPARVEMQFSVFVTPSGDVVRDLQGVAMDPTTMAESIEGDVNNRYPERIARGILSSAVDWLITEQAQERRSTFQEDSPRDEAIRDIRQRAGALIEGPIGDEGSLGAVVELEQNTPFIMVFGLNF